MELCAYRSWGAKRYKSRECTFKWKYDDFSISFKSQWCKINWIYFIKICLIWKNSIRFSKKYIEKFTFKFYNLIEVPSTSIIFLPLLVTKLTINSGKSIG